MAHILPYISKGITVQSLHTYREIKLFQRAFKNVSHSRQIKNNKSCVLRCSIASSTSSSAAAEQVEEDKQYLANEFGWKVRRLAENDYEMREVARLQAEAFHIPMPLFDDYFFEFFKAEVLAGLLYKLRNSPPDRYACLVADSSTSESNALVGVVDVTVLRDEDVLPHLKGAQEYLYISGIAVSQTLRRKKIGSVLLKACDVLSGSWGYEYLVLRAYEEDIGAQGLYTKAGYKVVSSDPQWMTWIGRKRRVLMIKQSNFHSLQF